MTTRAQTIHDYLLGVVLVILTIGVAIGLLGSAYEPFFDPVEAEDQTMAESLGDEVVDANKTMWGERTVDLDGLATLLEEDMEWLRQRAGIPHWKQVNVTIEHERVILASGGDRVTGAPDARSIRSIQSVQTEGQFGDCADGCRVVIRVW